jgi:hypothetical protein
MNADRYGHYPVDARGRDLDAGGRAAAYGAHRSSASMSVTIPIRIRSALERRGRTVATPEENAKRLMRDLGARKQKPNDVIQSLQLQRIAIASEIDGAEQIAAIEYAGKHDWIGDGPRPGTVVLTQDGWDTGNKR